MKGFHQFITDLQRGKTCFIDNYELYNKSKINKMIKIIEIIEIIKVIKIIKMI